MVNIVASSSSTKDINMLDSTN